MNAIAEQLGPFPRGALDFQKYSPDGKEKRVVDRADPQRGRQLKAECLVDGCGYIARVSALHLRRGAPVCPVHLQPMWHEELPPEQVEKPEELEAEETAPGAATEQPEAAELPVSVPVAEETPAEGAIINADKPARPD